MNIFTIEAKDAMGERVLEGGDVFQISVRCNKQGVKARGAWPADASQCRPRACPMNSQAVTCVWNRLGLVPVRVGPVCRGLLPGSWVSYDAAPPRRDSATGSCDEGAGSCSAQYVCV